jgi:ketosteroid isomerase-like protein
MMEDFPMKRFLILLLLGSLAWTVPVSADNSDSVAVRTAAQDLLAAASAGDTENLNRFFLSENSVFGRDGGPRSTFNASFLHNEFEAGLRYKLKWRHLDVKLYGDTAVTTGYAVGTVTHPDGAVKTGTWRTSLVWVKKDGVWKVAHDHTSKLFPEQIDRTS